eukprot:8203785-Pyramimonas_sp.AAC.1
MEHVEDVCTRVGLQYFKKEPSPSKDYGEDATKRLALLTRRRELRESRQSADDAHLEEVEKQLRVLSRRLGAARRASREARKEHYLEGLHEAWRKRRHRE